MVTLEGDEFQKLASEKQRELYMKLLSSSSFLKAERDYLSHLIELKVINSYDASVLIDYLICKIRLQKHFNGKRKHSVAKCFSCKSKFDLKRYIDNNDKNKYWLCSTCRFKPYFIDCVLVIRAKSKKAICTEDLQECDKCSRENCMVKTMSSSVSSVKEV